MTAILANGPIFDDAFLQKRLQKIPFWIAADGGLLHFHRLQLTPHLIVGDFDSIPQSILKEYDHIQQKKFQKDKDQSDLELAMEFRKNMPLFLFGALYKRMDHTLYNLYLLSRYPENAFIETHLETIFALNKKTTIKTSPGQTVSLMPLGTDAKNVTTKGLKWDLNHVTLNPHFMSLSNIAVDNFISINYTEGSILCFLQKELNE